MTPEQKTKLKRKAEHKITGLNILIGDIKDTLQEISVFEEIEYWDTTDLYENLIKLLKDAGDL